MGIVDNRTRALAATIDPVWSLPEPNEESEAEEQARAGLTRCNSLLAMGGTKKKKRPVLLLDPEEAASAYREMEMTAAQDFADPDRVAARQPALIGLTVADDEETAGEVTESTDWQAWAKMAPPPLSTYDEAEFVDEPVCAEPDAEAEERADPLPTEAVADVRPIVSGPDLAPQAWDGWDEPVAPPPAARALAAAAKPGPASPEPRASEPRASEPRASASQGPVPEPATFKVRPVETPFADYEPVPPPRPAAFVEVPFAEEAVPPVAPVEMPRRTQGAEPSRNALRRNLVARDDERAVQPSLLARLFAAIAGMLNRRG